MPINDAFGTQPQRQGRTQTGFGFIPTTGKQ